MADAFVFKGNLPSITLLKLYDANVDAIAALLREKKRSAPLMLVGMQVIVDLTECTSGDVNVSEIKRSLMDEGVMPIALMSQDFTLMSLCAKAKLGFIPPFKREDRQPTSSQLSESDNDAQAKETDIALQTSTSPVEQAVSAQSDSAENTLIEDSPVDSVVEPPPVENLVVTRQIRSGQRIYAKGDLTVVGSVGAGAEVIADGNIHIYGALRGRALAGAKGDEAAAIFCQNFAAELVSIAGFYVGAVDTDPQYNQAAVQISLNDEKIKFYRL